LRWLVCVPHPLRYALLVLALWHRMAVHCARVNASAISITHCTGTPVSTTWDNTALGSSSGDDLIMNEEKLKTRLATTRHNELLKPGDVEGMPNDEESECSVFVFDKRLVETQMCENEKRDVGGH
jgi:hypothetical protein